MRRPIERLIKDPHLWVSVIRNKYNIYNEIAGPNSASAAPPGAFLQARKDSAIRRG